MEIIISKDQYKKIVKESTFESKLNFFKRRYTDMVDHLKEIIYEGLWHYDVCDYKDFKEFYDMIVVSSVETFIYSYDELGGYEDNSMQEFLEKFVRNKFGNYIGNKWIERECGEKTLTEQPIGLLGSNPRINLSKSTKYPTGKFGRPEGDVDGDDLTCYISNIKNTIDKCKTIREYKVPDNRTNELSKKLFISMKGPSTGNETKKVLNEIKDKSEFCKVSNNFYYNNQGLNEWINDEMFLSPVDVWQIIKTKVGSYFIKDSCTQSKYEL